MHLCAAARWQEPAPGGSGASVGITVLQNRGLFTEGWWRWLSVGVLVAYAVVLNIAVLLAQTFLNRAPPPVYLLC